MFFGKSGDYVGLFGGGNVLGEEALVGEVGEDTESSEWGNCDWFCGGVRFISGWAIDGGCWVEADGISVVVLLFVVESLPGEGFFAFGLLFSPCVCSCESKEGRGYKRR